MTANRRRENIQDVPISITALTENQLQKSGVYSSADLAIAVPGLTIQNSGAGLQPHLRGIGNSAFAAGQENSVATYVDGVYIASLNGDFLDLNNISAIEVDKGPQGTLFGRNATGGVINITTRDPSSHFGGLSSLSYGNYNTFATSDYLTGPVTSNLAADLAIHYSNQASGWGVNLFNGSDADKTRELAVRSKWLLTPTDRDRLTAAFDYEQTDSTWLIAWRGYDHTVSNWGPGAPAPFGQPFVFPGGYWDVDVPFTPTTNVKQGGASLTYEHRFDFATLTNIAAYRMGETFSHLTPQPVPTDAEAVTYTDRERQFSEELRLTSSDRSRIKWVAGLYYLNASAGYDPFDIFGSAVATPPLQSLNFHVYQTTRSYAVFGQTTVPVPWIANTNFTAGLRWTSESRGLRGYTFLKFVPAFGIPDVVAGDTNVEKTFDKVTWRLAVDHRFTENVLGYVSYNRGFKSGVYNTIPPGGPGATPVRPEVLDAYEIGLKSDLFDRRLRLNVAAFDYSYSQMQVQIYTPLAIQLENGAKAQIYGLELSGQARLTDNLTLDAGLSALHSEFLSFPAAPILIPQTVAQGGGNIAVLGSAKGKRLPYTPDVSFNVSADYTKPFSNGTLDLSATYSYAAGWFAGPDNVAKSPASNVLNGQLGWTFPDGRTRVALWAKNIINQAVPTIIAEGANPGGGDQAIYGAPRTFGVTLQYKFGAQ